MPPTITTDRKPSRLANNDMTDTVISQDDQETDSSHDIHAGYGGCKLCSCPQFMGHYNYCQRGSCQHHNYDHV